MISTLASAVNGLSVSGVHSRFHPQNFHQLWKVPFSECRSVVDCDLGRNRNSKAIDAMLKLQQVINIGPLGAISKCLSQTIKYTAYAENLYIAYCLSNVACQLNGMDLQPEAEILHRRALCIGIRCIGSSNPLLADSMEWLAFSLYRQGNNKEALLLCLSASILLQKSLGKYHPDTGTCHLNLSVVLESLGRTKDAEGIQQKVKTSVSGTMNGNEDDVEHQKAAVFWNYTSETAWISHQATANKTTVNTYQKAYGLQNLSVS